MPCFTICNEIWITEPEKNFEQKEQPTHLKASNRGEKVLLAKSIL